MSATTVVSSDGSKVSLLDGVPVRLVALQFMLSEKFVRENPNILLGVKLLPPENPLSERPARKERNESNEKNALLIEPTKRVCLSLLFTEPNFLASFELVDAKQQLHKNDQGGWNYVVRYLFAKKEFSDVSQEFLQRRDNILDGLRVLCKNSMWRVQAFQNPCYNDGKMMEGFTSFEFDLKEREDLFEDDGQPKMIWPRNEEGCRIWNAAKVPLKPNHRLGISNGVIKLYLLHKIYG